MSLGSYAHSLQWYVVLLHLTFSWSSLIHQNEPRQSNGHDCGLWVLSVMGAMLRGYADTSLSEAEMGHVRRVFADHILTLPFTGPRTLDES